MDKQIAYLGLDDRFQGYQVTHLYVMNRDGSGKKLVAGDFDRDVANLHWSNDGSGLFFLYDDEGNTKIGFVSLDGKVDTLAEDVGGLSLGRPYSGGTYSVAERRDLRLYSIPSRLPGRCGRGTPWLSGQAI